MNPLFINIVSIISIIVMVILIGVMFYKKPLKLGKNIIWFSIPTFIVGFFLHLIAYIEANTNDPLIYGLLTTIFTTIKMFGFNVNDTLLAALVHENFLYTVAVVITHLVSSFNTILILIILLLAGFGNDLKVLMYKKTNHFIVFGSNKEVLTFVKNLHQKVILIIQNNSELKKEIKTLKIKNFAYIINDDINKALDKAGIETNNTTVVVLEKEDNVSINIALSVAEKLPKYNKAYINYSNLDTVTFINTKEKNIVFFNKEKMIAHDFINRYPLLSFLDNDYIDYNKAILKNKKISHLFVGYTNILECLLEELIFNYQFVNNQMNLTVFCEKADKIKKHYYGKYYSAEVIKTLNKDLYYDLPKNDINEDFKDTDYKSLEFKQEILKSLKDFNFIYIDLNDDQQNFETALMLNYFLTTNNIKDFKIFVRLTNKKYYDIEKLSLENIYIFGETDNIYAKSILVDQKLDNLAKQVNYYYLKKDPSNTLNIDEAWNECSYFNKASSRSSANSIIIKLNLLGLTLKETKEGLTKEEYLRYYNDNKALEEDVFFDINTYQYDNKRINLGILEHLRWNTFEIYNNHLPMEKSKILNVKNKHYQRKDNTLKQHANILSMQGLFELEKALKDVDFVPYRDKTIFIKDFDLMDNLYEIIQDSDYKIVKK